MLEIWVKDSTDGEGKYDAYIKAVGSAELIAIQLHAVIKKLAESCPPLMVELNKIVEDELKN